MADPTADRVPGEPTPAWGDVTQLEAKDNCEDT